MRTTLLFLFVLMYTEAIMAQPNTPSATTDSLIAEGRMELKSALVNRDFAGVSYWTENLLYQEDSTRCALVWDEKWMLFHWMGQHQRVLDEVKNFRIEEAYKRFMPGQDSLFQVLDSVLLADKEWVYDGLRKALLSEEARQFCVLHIDYLLRLDERGLDPMEQDEKIRNYFKRYPEAPYRQFARQFMYEGTVISNYAIEFDLGFTYGNWREQLGFTLDPLYAVHVSGGFWWKRFHSEIRILAGGPKLNQSVWHKGYEWPKDDPTNYLSITAHAGYDLVNNSKLRIAPSIGAGFSGLTPPGTDEGESSPEDYYEEFRFYTFAYDASVAIDIKLGSTDKYDRFARKNYIGPRVKIGYQGLAFGRQNRALTGDMFYITTCFHIFAHQRLKQSL